jgi:hypothetical protein
MMTPKQFLEAFWQEKIAANAERNTRLEVVHRKYFGQPLLGHAADFLVRSTGRGAEFEEVRESGGSAIVIVQEPLVADSFSPKRYHLSSDGEDWKITQIDSECLDCRGTGLSGQMACQKCDGEGWYDPRKDTA